jgi:hypothetical protein
MGRNIYEESLGMIGKSSVFCQKIETSPTVMVEHSFWYGLVMKFHLQSMLPRSARGQMQGQFGVLSASSES